MWVQHGEIVVGRYDGRAKGMDLDMGSCLVSLRGSVCGKSEMGSLVGHGTGGMVDLGYDEDSLEGWLDYYEDGSEGFWIDGRELV